MSVFTGAVHSLQGGLFRLCYSLVGKSSPFQAPPKGILGVGMVLYYWSCTTLHEATSIIGVHMLGLFSLSLAPPNLAAFAASNVIPPAL